MALLQSILLIFLSAFCLAQNTSTSEKINHISSLVSEHHFQTRAQDNSYSQLVFNQFIELLNTSCLLLTSEDIESLSAYEKSIGNPVLEGNLGVIEEAQSLVSLRLAQLKVLIDNIEIGMPKDANLLTEIKMVTNDALESYWKKNIAQLSLYKYFSSTPKAEQSEEDFKSKFEETFKSIQKTLLCHLAEIEVGITSGEFVETCFLKSLAFAYDPHTEYFPAQEEFEFSQSLSKSKLSFGLYFKYNLLGQLEIDGLYPGGPAWNSGLINEGDILLKVKVDSKNYNVECGHMTEIFSLFMSEESPIAEMSFRKKDGTIINVSLMKEQLDNNENNLNGFILSQDLDIGYIYLPSFYSSLDIDTWTHNENCSTDLAKELIKMKRKDIKGLILDLRDNGGGSMQEALSIAGAFIDKGTLSIVSDGKELISYKDMNRGTAFEKPLVLIVNEWSASASELLAGTLQDHGRAIIVGDRTFGKGTMQEIFPMPNGKDYLKITTGAFYRVTGESHQGRGIEPDISFSNPPKDAGELAYASCLSLDPVEKKTYYMALESGLTDSLVSASKDRFVKRSEGKEGITKTINSVGLTYKAYQAYYTKTAKSEATVNKSYTFKVYPLNPDGYSANHLDLDKVKTEIKHDTYVIESFKIITDIIHNSTKSK